MKANRRPTKNPLFGIPSTSGNGVIEISFLRPFVPHSNLPHYLKQKGVEVI